jgi:phage-related protein
MAAEQREWTVGEYETPSGEAPVMTLLNSLTDRRAVKEAAALLLQLRARGNTLREPRSKALGEGLYELRGQQVRIFYMFRPGRRITLLDGMVKKQDRIPADLMARLRRFQQEIEALDARRHAP